MQNMSSQSQPSHPQGGSRPEGSGNLVIIGGSVAAIAAVWSFILFGPRGLGVWGVVVASVVTVGIVLVGIRWRKKRAAQHLALLDQWAEKESRQR